MIGDWYFCCCIKATPSQTVSFLAVLDTLSDPDADAPLLSATFAELLRLDVWMQLYALPHVLRARSSALFPDSIAGDVTDYFQKVFSHVPEELVKPSNDVCKLLLEETDAQHLLNAVTKVASGLQALPRREVSPAPYMDLYTFAAECLCAAALLDRAESDDHFASRVHSVMEDQEDAAALTLMLADCLEGRRGRLAYRLTWQLWALGVGVDDDDLHRFNRLPGSALPFEPDLLDTLAIVMFACGRRVSKADTVDRLVEESVRLSVFELWREGSRGSIQAALHRVGMLPTQDGVSLLKAVYWQAVLWTAAARIDAESAACALGELWVIPDSQTPTSVQVVAPCSPKDRSSWGRSLAALLQLRPPPLVGGRRTARSTRINVKGGDTMRIPAETAGLLFSPWMSLTSKDHALKWFKARYPKADDSAALIRLCSAAIVAVRLRQQVESEKRTGDRLAELIAHTSDVLRCFPWLRYYERNAPGPRDLVINPPLIGLAFHARRQVELAGRGTLESISPTTFLNIAREASGTQVARTRDRAIFLERLLPCTLVRWVTDAFVGADGSSEQGRWLEYVKEVHNLFQAGPQHSDFEKIPAALMKRFLAPSDSDEHGFDWTSSTKRDGNGSDQWQVDSRKMLLSRPLSPDAWLRPDWEEEGIHPPTLLARAVERVSALGRGSVGDDVESAWRNDLSERLDSIAESWELDRFQRLRLLELLNEPALRDDGDTQNQIALLLLEYAGPYELNQMFEALFSKEQLLAAREDVQRSVVEAMAKAVEQNEEPGTRLGVMDPRVVRNSTRRVEVLNRLLQIIALVDSEATANRKQLQSRLRRLQQKTRRKGHQALCINLTLGEGRPSLVRPPHGHALEHWRIAGATYDCNKAQAHIFVEEYELVGLTNVFALGMGHYDSFCKGEIESPTQVVALVVESKPRKSGRFCRLNCGLPYLLFGTVKLARLSPGTVVRVKVAWIDSGKKARWQIDGIHSVRPLRRSSQEGNFKRLVVRESWEQRFREMYVFEPRPKGRGDSMHPARRDLWDPDAVRRFRGQDKTEVEVEAVMEENSFVPIDNDLLTLLLDSLGSAEGGAAVLTVIDVEPAVRGEVYIRFSERPGKNYLLGEKDFKPEDWLTLMTKLADRSTARGLLVSVVAEKHSHGVRLALRHEPSNDVEVRYPQLQAPFDERNWDWRRLIRVDEVLEANLEAGDWWIDLEGRQPAGFPARLRVKLIPAPKHGSVSTECTVSRWDSVEQRLAEVQAKPVYAHRMNLRPGHELESLKHWIQLTVGDQLTVTRAISGLRDDGLVRFLVRNGASVLVERESLSMLPFAPDESLEMRKDRRCVVHHIDHFVSRPAPEIDPDELPERVHSEGKGTAVLTASPRAKEKATLCEMTWVYSDDFDHRQVHIDNLNRLRGIGCGAILEASEQAGEWRFRLKSLQVLVRALWTCDEWSEGDSGLFLLGRVDWGDGTRLIAQSEEPGRLALLPEGNSQGEYLATIQADGTYGKPLLRGNLVTNNRASDKTWWEEGMRVRRAQLPLTDQAAANVLVGVCSAESPVQKVSVIDVRHELRPESEKLFTLRRFFRLEKVLVKRSEEGRTRTSRSSEAKGQSEDVWARRWQQFLEDPTQTVTGRLLDDENVLLDWLRVPANGKWHRSVKLRHDDGPYITFARYEGRADFLLVKDSSEGPWVASVRGVPPWSIERYFREVNATLGEEVRLNAPLYYVRPDPGPNAEPQPDEGPYHLFEWFPGRTLRVAESALQFDGKPFAAAEHLMLYHGDELWCLRFLKESTPGMDGEQGASRQLVMSIDGVHLRYSDGRTLFGQRRNHSMVHVLKLLRLRDGRLRIERVLGYDVIRSDSPLRTFDRLNAILAPKDIEPLTQRLGKEGRATILGRLNDDQFEATFGREIEFSHVRMSTAGGGVGNPLEVGELFFVEADVITPFYPNDTALTLLPLAKIAEEDVDPKFTERLRLLRRSFSEREELLERIMTREGKDALKGDFLVVRLGQDKRGQVIVTFSEKIPSRLLRALRSAIAAQEGSLLASVAQSTRDADSVRLELKPGSYAYLEPHNLTSGDQFRRGDVVQVENQPSGANTSPKFRLTRAVFSHERYIGRIPRPAVALPKDILLRKRVWQDHDVGKDGFWLSEMFTIGDFSNLEANCGRFDLRQNEWNHPGADDCIALMRTPHPKVVALGRDSSGRLRIGPPLPGLYWGMLQPTDDHSVSAITFHGDETNEQPVAWRFQTFGDESAAAAVARSHREQWHYHDKKTGHWTKDSVSKEPTGTHRSSTGPLFFEERHGSLCLRFGRDFFLSRGLPVNALIASLASRRGLRGKYPVAGWSEEGGLWLELAPGRISEVPSQLLFHLRNRQQHPLSRMDWQRFAPGDSVKLLLTRSDVFAVDRFAMLAWEPGPRGSFGPSGAWLPIAEQRSKDGALTLGAGCFQLTIPFVRTPEGWDETAMVDRVVCLRTDNSLMPFEHKPPEIGTVVLLVVDDSGQLVIAGFEGIRPLPDGNFEEHWADDPFAQYLLDRARGRVGMHRDRAHHLVDAVGGALPVTVEGTHQDMLFFSRRHQKGISRLREGLTSNGKILGLLDDPGSGSPSLVVVRSGGGLVPVSSDKLVSGLPIKYTAAAVEALRNDGLTIWLRQTVDRGLLAGYDDEPHDEFDVIPKIVLGRVDVDRTDSGMICRSLLSERLYWLPCDEVGWASLEADDLDRHFIQKSIRCRVVRKETARRTPIVSMVETQEARNEWEELEVGRELTVEIVQEGKLDETGNAVTYLVRSLRSKILLELTHYGDAPLQRERERRVEVIARLPGAQPRCKVALIGERRYSLDLPFWMQAPPSPTGTLRPEFMRYIEWRKEEPSPPPEPGAYRLDEMDAAQTVQHLCHALTRTERGERALWPDVEIARRWLRKASKESELELHLALAAILVLSDRSSLELKGIAAEMMHLDFRDVKRRRNKWRFEARDALQDLGRRALRSLHVDLLVTHWFCRKASMGLPSLHRRLELLRETIRPPLSIDDIRSVRRFCRAVRLRGDTDLQRIAYALMASIGELLDITDLMRKKVGERSVTEDLAALYRISPASYGQRSPRLQPIHVKRLWDLLYTLEVNRWDITLLGPLPVFGGSDEAV